MMNNIEKNYFNNNNNRINIRGSVGYNDGIKQDMSDNFLSKKIK